MLSKDLLIMFVLPSGVIKNNNKKAGVYIVLYDDDILLMAPSVDVADQLLKSVERELINLDMVINAKKIVWFTHCPKV